MPERFQRAKKRKLRMRIFLYALSLALLAQNGFCDRLFLKENEDGHAVEILEEKKHSFIIEMPKSEIRKVKRKRPTDAKLWKEKRIIWEDVGDYIVVYLPKEKIVLPEGYKGSEYNSAQVFVKEGLSSTGTKGHPPGMSFLGTAGRVRGRVVRYGKDSSGVKIKIVNVSYQDNIVSRIFGPKDTRPEDLVLEATTDELGCYEFDSVPLGEYDIYWQLPAGNNWYRRLSEKPSITVRPGETVEYPDIEIK